MDGSLIAERRGTKLMSFIFSQVLETPTPEPAQRTPRPEAPPTLTEMAVR